MAYAVSIRFKAEDRVSEALNRRIIPALEKADKAFKKVENEMRRLGVRSGQASQQMTQWSQRMSTLNRKLGTTDAQMVKVNRTLGSLGTTFGTTANQAHTFRNALGGMNRGLGSTGSHARRARHELGLLHKALHGIGKFGHGIVGGAMGFGGFMAVGGAMAGGHTIAHSAMEQARMMNQLKLQRFSTEEQKVAKDKAWSLSEKIPTTSVHAGLEMMKEAHAIFRDKGLTKTLPIVEQLMKLETITRASSSEAVRGRAGQMTGSAAKIIEMLGHTEDLKESLADVDMMAKQLVTFNGAVDPTKMAQVLSKSRQGKFGLGREYMGAMLGHLVQEYGIGGKSTGSQGIGPMQAAWTSAMVQGKMTNVMLENYGRFGIIPGIPKKHEKRTQGEVMETVRGHMPDQALAIEDPDKWWQKYAVPKMAARHKMTAEQYNEHIQTPKGQRMAAADIAELSVGARQTFGDLIAQFTIQHANISRQREFYRDTPGVNGLYEQAKKDPGTGLVAIQTAFEKIGDAIGQDAPLMEAFANSCISVAKSLSSVAIYFKDNPISKWLDTFPNISARIRDISTDFASFAGLVVSKTGEMINWIMHAIDGVLGFMDKGAAMMPWMNSGGSGSGGGAGSGGGGGGGGGGMGGFGLVPPPAPYMPVLPGSGGGGALPSPTAVDSNGAKIFPGAVSVPKRKASAGGGTPVAFNPTINVHGNDLHQVRRELHKHTEDLISSLQMQLMSTSTGGGNLSSPAFTDWSNTG